VNICFRKRNNVLINCHVVEFCDAVYIFYIMFLKVYCSLAACGRFDTVYIMFLKVNCSRAACGHYDTVYIMFLKVYCSHAACGHYDTVYIMFLKVQQVKGYARNLHIFMQNKPCKTACTNVLPDDGHMTFETCRRHL
jgi:hypothetical protein